MKLVSKQDAGKRVQMASGVAEVEIKSAADLSKLLTDLKQQASCIVLICLK